MNRAAMLLFGLSLSVIALCAGMKLLLIVDTLPGVTPTLVVVVIAWAALAGIVAAYIAIDALRSAKEMT